MLGPSYSYADEMKTPSEIGVRKDGSVGAIMDSIAAVNYYTDTIGFGHSTALAKSNGLQQNPLGIRYFIKTGNKCSNGADMHEYVDTVPKPLPGKVGREIENAFGVKFQGLAPGIVQDAANALNPVPLFKAAMGSGYAKCKKVTLPVGDMNGKLVGYDGNRWISDPVQMVNGRPHQTRWIYDSDMTQDAYNATPKTEGFSLNSSHIAAGVLCASLILGTMLVVKSK